jgi:hypothetical protein
MQLSWLGWLTTHSVVFSRHNTDANRSVLLNRKVLAVTASLVFALASNAALAVAQVPANTTKTSATATSFTPKAGPTVEATKVGVQHASNASKAPAAYDAHVGAGRNVALMVVGGAALIIGAIIGGAPGVLIAVAGAAVGLYGLYYFIQ